MLHVVCTAKNAEIDDLLPEETRRKDRYTQFLNNSNTSPLLGAAEASRRTFNTHKHAS